MLPNVITKPPLFIPNDAIKRALHVVFVAPPRPRGTSIANHGGTTNASTCTLTSSLLEPASLALSACSVGIGCY